MFIFWLISGWWYIPDLRVFFFVCVSHIRAVCFIFWHSEPMLLSDLWPAVSYLRWVALLLFLSLTGSFCNCATEKSQRSLCFFEKGEEETTVLQTPCLKADKLQQVPNQWQNVAKLAAGSAPLSSNMTSEERWLHLKNSLDFWSSKHNWLGLLMNVN